MVETHTSRFTLATAPSIDRDAFCELFAVGKPLGEGGFGAVLRGVRLATGEAVALKMVDLNRGGTELIEEEVRCWGMIKHPNCVYLIDVYTISPYVALVMEICEGGSLLDRLADAEDFMSEEQAQRFCACWPYATPAAPVPSLLARVATCPEQLCLPACRQRASSSRP